MSDKTQVKRIGAMVCYPTETYCAEATLLGEKFFGPIRKISFPSDPSAQVERATLLSQIIENHAPRIPEYLTRLRYEDDHEATIIRGLPHDEDLAPLLTLALSRHVGEVFNYTEQNEGVLAMRLVPSDLSTQNTNTTRDEFAWHTDDAAMLEALRANWLVLNGVRNPPRTVTRYVPIRPVLHNISPRIWDILSSPRYSVRIPESFGLGDDLWTGPRSLINIDDNAMITIACPTYATRTVDPRDVDAQQAFEHLCTLLDHHAISVALSPGTLLAFNNFRGLHMRSAIGKVDRLVIRTYVRPDLAALRRQAGHDGYVFSLANLLPDLRRFAVP